MSDLAPNAADLAEQAAESARLKSLVESVHGDGDLIKIGQGIQIPEAKPEAIFGWCKDCGAKKRICKCSVGQGIQVPPISSMDKGLSCGDPDCSPFSDCC